jgi:outer membrane protein OmpA-like peptidoglycan-associated protein
MCVMLLGALAYAAVATHQFAAGEKAKITGRILSRDGDLIQVADKKSGSVVVVDITDNTKIERKKGTFKFRKSDMDVTAMLPGLTVDAEGVGNAKGQLEAAKIAFSPDDFAIEVAQEQQIEANKAAAAGAQSTANQGVAEAGQAQASADTAQATANQGVGEAQAAGTVALLDAAAIGKVNKRVSDLGEYKTVVEAALFFPSDGSTLSADDQKALDKLAKDAMAIDNYMIEIAGYASSTGGAALNQKLSDARATAVANYLRNTGNVPMRRILAPAGYGATHAAAPNSDAMGRDINRRVDVKVLVNKGLEQGM